MDRHVQPQGSTEAEVLAWVQERVERGGGGGEDTPRERLDRWTRLHQPPFRRERKLPFRYVVSVLPGLAFIGFGLVASSIGRSSDLAPPGAEAVTFALTLIPITVGCGVIIFALVQSIKGLVGANPSRRWCWTGARIAGSQCTFCLRTIGGSPTRR